MICFDYLQQIVFFLFPFSKTNLEIQEVHKNAFCYMYIFFNAHDGNGRTKNTAVQHAAQCLISYLVLEQ